MAPRRGDPVGWKRVPMARLLGGGKVQLPSGETVDLGFRADSWAMGLVAAMKFGVPVVYDAVTLEAGVPLSPGFCQNVDLLVLAAPMGFRDARRNYFEFGPRRPFSPRAVAYARQTDTKLKCKL